MNLLTVSHMSFNPTVSVLYMCSFKITNGVDDIITSTFCMKNLMCKVDYFTNPIRIMLKNCDEI